jgi:hypothetical protein
MHRMKDRYTRCGGSLSIIELSRKGADLISWQSIPDDLYLEHLEVQNGQLGDKDE